MSYYKLQSYTQSGGCSKDDNYTSNNIQEIIDYLTEDLQDFYAHFSYGSKILLLLKDIEDKTLYKLEILNEFESHYIKFTNNIKIDNPEFTIDDCEDQKDYDDYLEEEANEKIWDITDYEVIKNDDGTVQIKAIDFDAFIIVDINKILNDISEYKL